MGAIDEKIEDITRRLAVLPYATESLEGCTGDDIAKLESYADADLPYAYKRFLQVMGKRQGKLFKGSESSINDRFELRLRRFAENLLERKEAEFTLPSNAFVFLMHQGYQYLYFETGKGDDPPVYLVGERNLLPKKLAESFTDYLSSFVSDLEQIAKTKPDNFKPL